MKIIKYISWYLGITIFVFGILKVLVPTINGWYTIQMTNSGLEKYVPFWLGITGEIVTGLTFIIALVPGKNLPKKSFEILLQLASVVVIFMMMTAVYVHLQPTVPAEVLPLGIKAPYIPVLTMLIALINIILIQIKDRKT